MMCGIHISVDGEEELNMAVEIRRVEYRESVGVRNSTKKNLLSIQIESVIKNRK